MAVRFELVKALGPAADAAFRALEAELAEGPALDLEALIEVFEDAANRWPDTTVAGVFHGDMDDWLLMVARDGAGIETFLDLDEGRLVDPSGEYADVLRQLGQIQLGHAAPPPPPETLPEADGTDNPLRIGTREERIALAKKADAMPSRANLAQLVEARFAPEHRANQLADLRLILDRAIGRHEEAEIARAIEEVLERGEPSARAELATFVASADDPAAVLARLADSRG